MRAVVLRNGRLQVRATPDPTPGPGELLLKTLSTAICASDVHYLDHPELAINDPTGRSLYDPDRDIVLGHEFVGEVIGFGPGCTDDFAVGSRVTAMPVRLVEGGAGGLRIIGQHPEAQGSFAELLVVSEAAAKPVTGDVSSDAVALTDAFAVGEFYVRSARLRPGEVPIVIGAGAIGLSAVAALASRGIEPIVVTDFKADRRDLARAGFGAHIVVDPAATPAFDAFREVRAQRGLPGPAVVFECVGAPGLIQRIVEEAEMGTRIYCAGGWYTGDALDITTATRQGVTIQFGGGPHPPGLVRHARCDRVGTAGPAAQRRQDHHPRRGPRRTGTGPQIRGSAADHRSPERSRRMTEREDRQDISDLLVRYATAIDRREYQLLGTVFTDQCDVDYGEIGTWRTATEVIEFMDSAHAMAGYTLHRLSNIAITIEGDHAEARTYIDGLIMAADNQGGVNAVGFYDDVLVRTADGWRITRRQFTAVRVVAVG
ncbi:hypothetical protein IWGMT90018_02770 [Mycobacterium kiyosense]|nr:hypothetical protein IWGMT90018_02770 [Mycobacterium kiyosense]